FIAKFASGSLADYHGSRFRSAVRPFRSMRSTPSTQGEPAFLCLQFSLQPHVLIQILRYGFELSTLGKRDICCRSSALQHWHTTDRSKSTVRFDCPLCRGTKRSFRLGHGRGLLGI